MKTNTDHAAQLDLFATVYARRPILSAWELLDAVETQIAVPRGDGLAMAYTRARRAYWGG